MKKRFRLRRQGDFQRVLRSRRLFAGRTLVAFARPGEGEGLRVGVAVTRQIRGAVARNRARRRLREAVRERLLGDWGEDGRGIGYDVVLIARLAALTEPQASLEREVGAVRRLLES